MLLGQYYGIIGEKNRCAFPKKFREFLGDKLIITRGFESSLIVVAERSWKSLLQGTQDHPFTVSGARDTQRFLLGNAAFVELDEKGRFIVPEHLKAFAGVENEIVFLGISEYVEIWDKKKWEEYNNRLTQEIGTIAEKLSVEKDHE